MDETNYNAPIDELKKRMMFSTEGEDKELCAAAMDELSNNKGEDE